MPDTASVSNVEIVNIVSENGVAPWGSNSLTNASNYVGVEQLWQIGGATHVMNVTNEVVAGFDSVTDLGGDAEWGNQVGTVAAATEANIALANVDGAALTAHGEWDGEASQYRAGNQLNTVNVVGALSDADDEIVLNVIAGNNVETVFVNSEVNAELGVVASQNAYAEGAYDAEADTVAELDASGSTGDIEVNASKFDAVTLGAGDDVLIFDEAPSLFQDIDAGEGLDIAALGLATFQTEDYDAINQMENVEALGFYNGEDDIKLDAAEVAEFKTLVFGLEDDVSGWVDAEISNLAADQQLVVTADDGADLVLKDSAADVSLLVEEDAWADLWIANDGLGETGGTLTLTGEGMAWVDNVAMVGAEDAGKFATIDASGLEGGVHVWEMAAGFEETVLLGDGSDMVGIDVRSGEDLSSSTKGATDLIVDFNSDLNDEDHDVLWIDGMEAPEAGYPEKVDVSSAESLNQAYAEAAAEEYGDDLVFFLWEGDTYLFANTGTAAGYDNSDFALQLTGEHNFAQEGLIDWGYDAT